VSGSDSVKSDYATTPRPFDLVNTVCWTSGKLGFPSLARGPGWTRPPCGAMVRSAKPMPELGMVDVTAPNQYPHPSRACMECSSSPVAVVGGGRGRAALRPPPRRYTVVPG
jgi:hypothetical protein